MTTKIKCIFCGLEELHMPCQDLHYWVECKHCKARGPISSSFDDALILWERKEMKPEYEFRVETEEDSISAEECRFEIVRTILPSLILKYKDEAVASSAIDIADQVMALLYKAKTKDEE